MGKVTYFKSPDDEEDIAKEELTQEEKEILEEEKKKSKLRYEIRRSIFPLILFGLILGVGIFLIIYGAKPQMFRDKTFVATQATVVKYEWRPTRRIGPMPHPVYEYVFDGKEYTLESKTGVRPEPYKIGEVITIYVNPIDPTDVIAPISYKSYIIVGMVISMIAFFALCVVGIRPILEAAYPKSDWPKFIALYIPSMIFVWTGVIIGCALVKSISNGSTAELILMILGVLLVAAFATFISVLMIKDMVKTVKLNSRIANIKSTVTTSTKSTQYIRYQSAKPKKKKKKR